MYKMVPLSYDEIVFAVADFSQLIAPFAEGTEPEKSFRKMLLLASQNALADYRIDTKREVAIDKLVCLLQFTYDDLVDIQRARRRSKHNDSWTVHPKLVPFAELAGHGDGKYEFIAPFVHEDIKVQVPGNKPEDCLTYSDEKVSIKGQVSPRGQSRILMPNIGKSKGKRDPTAAEIATFDACDDLYKLLLVFESRAGEVTVTHRRHSDYNLVFINEFGGQCRLKEASHVDTGADTGEFREVQRATV